MASRFLMLVAAGLLLDSTFAQPTCLPAWCEAGSFSGGSSTTTIRALALFDDGTGEKLYAGGVFDRVGNLPAQNLAVFDGVRWRPVFPGTDGEVRTLRVLDDGSGPALFVGGRFQHAGGQPAALLAKYDGWVWTPVPGLANYPGTLASWTTIYDVTTWNRGNGPELYVGGFFGLIGSTDPVSVARLTEEGFEPLSSGLTATPFQGIIGVAALRVLDLGDGPALYVGGTFATAGGIAAQNIARWDGSAWSALGGGLVESGRDGYVIPTVTAILPALDAGPPALLVAGDFAVNGVAGVAQWDGASWNVLPGDFVPNGPGRITVLGEGSDAAVFAYGRFSTINGLPANGVARWNGERWTNVGPALPNQGIYDLIEAVDHRGPALFAAGRELLNSTQVARLGALVGDLDCDSEVGLSDLAILLAAFGVSPDGDLDGDGSTSLADLATLLSKLGNACAD